MIPTAAKKWRRKWTDTTSISRIVAVATIFCVLQLNSHSRIVFLHDVSLPRDEQQSHSRLELLDEESLPATRQEQSHSEPDFHEEILPLDAVKLSNSELLELHEQASIRAKRHQKSHSVFELHEEVSLPELRNARDLLLRAKKHPISPLRQIDREKYTVRINTWHRNEQLLASIDHLRTCKNIAQIQVIWCDRENDPPPALSEYSKDGVPVIVEHHEINSLNERFRVLTETTPTYGILSVDDDVLRPCEAMDAGFYRWTDHPDRIVGYDYRVHMITDVQKDKPENSTGLARIDESPVWKYGYLSSTKERNEYSITLPRFCFVHRDYLNLYMTYAPKRVLTTVDEKFNCEDIALSFFISALTHGKVPLLVDNWASKKSMVKLPINGGISGSKGHKRIRDNCVDKFAFLLGLKDGYSLLDDKKNEVWGKFEAQQIWHGEGYLHRIGADVDPTDKLYEGEENFVSSRKDFAAKLVKYTKGQPFQDKVNKLKKKVKELDILKKES